MMHGTVNLKEEVLLRVKEQRNIVHEISKEKVNERKIKGRIEVKGRLERRCSKLLDELKERRGYSHLNEEALDRTVWRAQFGRGFGPVVRETAK
jgi:hypothetical protein